MTNTIFHTFFNFARGKNLTKTKDNYQKQIEDSFTDKTAEKNNALKAKRARVDGTWNKIKSIFGCEEKLTKDEYIELIKIDQADRWKARFAEEEAKQSQSIWQQE